MIMMTIVTFIYLFVFFIFIKCNKNLGEPHMGDELEL